MDQCLKSPRPASSIASKSSGRVSQQSFLRPDDIQAFHRETILTPNGFKTVRIYAATDESMNSMNKYQQRPRTAIGIERTADINKLDKPKNERLLQRAASANGCYKTQGKKANEEPDNTTPSKSNTPTKQIPTTKQAIYNTRHPSCKPSNLYAKDEHFSNPKKDRQRSKSEQACEDCSSVERYNAIQRRRTKSSDFVYKFNGPVHCPNFVKDNPFLTHNRLDNGQKQYIWGTAKVYSVETMKSLRQRHYQSILDYEYMKRISTRNIEKSGRIKLWKEYLDYQRVIDRFGRRGPRPSISKIRHSHAKKHDIVGWTTEASNGESEDASSSADSLSNAESSTDHVDASLNDDSFIYTDDGTATDNGSTWEAQREMLQREPRLESSNGKDRPKSAKYRIRKPLSPAKGDENIETEIQDIKVDETLSGELAEKLSIENADQNFI